MKILFYLALAAASVVAQTPASPPAQEPPAPVLAAPAPIMPPLSASAAKCQITLVREVGLVKLAQMKCPDNKVSMEIWLPPREKAAWLTKDVWVNAIPTGMGQDVRYSPGRQPRSDYSRPKAVHLLLSAGPVGKVVATLVSLTFH